MHCSQSLLVVFGNYCFKCARSISHNTHQVTPVFWDIPGLSWDVPCGILRTLSHTNLQGRPRAVLGCPLWDPPDTKSHQYSGMSQGCPWMSLLGSSGHQVTPVFRDIPGLSWDVPCSILQTPSHTNIQGLSWDVPCSDSLWIPYSFTYCVYHTVSTCVMNNQ